MRRLRVGARDQRGPNGTLSARNANLVARRLSISVIASARALLALPFPANRFQFDPGCVFAVRCLSIIVVLPLESAKRIRLRLSDDRELRTNR